VLAAAFLVLGWLMAGGSLNRFDSYLALRVYGLRSTGLNLFMVLLSYLGEQAIIVASVAICIALFRTRRWQELKAYLFLMGGSEALSFSLKAAFARHRPTLIPLEHAVGYSFPSGHAQDSIVFYGAVAFWLWQAAKRSHWSRLWLVLAGLISLAVGFSRVYLGAHFPSDILGGYLVGGAWLLGMLGKSDVPAVMPEEVRSNPKNSGQAAHAYVITRKDEHFPVSKDVVAPSKQPW
jgi:undecaprenyl-diphosphatase